ncbi:MAG: hypothetical protein RLY86_855 [Pseudomonadota bacterium]
MTKLVLSKLRYNDRPLELLKARSAGEAEGILRRRDDIAVALVDIVMETDDAGLRLARRIREDFANTDVRIVLRTGQPGQAPVRDVIVNYDINDYKSKTELTSEKLFITIVTALRSFDNIRSARAAESASKLKSSFLAAMSHEIRTPMNGVLGMLELLSHSRLDHDQQEMLATARDSAGALLRIIDDILDFSKIEAGRMDIDRHPVNLGTLVESVAETVAANARKKGLALHIDVDPEIPDTLYGDPVRLRQVLFNLTGNAIKFTECGSVTVRVRRLPATASGQVRVSVAVTDTGIGIADDMQSKLFHPFTQAEKSTSRRFGGTGLGLSISRRLVELMGGEIGLESALGQGSTFWFELSLESAAAASPDRPLDGVPIALRIEDRTLGETVSAYLGHAGARIGGPDPAALPTVTIVAPGAGSAWPTDLTGPAILLAEPDGRPSGTPPTVPLVSLPLRRQHLIRGIAQAAGLLSAGAGAGAGEGGAVGAGAVAKGVRPDRRLSQRRILVAEDQPVNQMVIRRQLKILGYDCDIQPDGVLALEAWRGGGYDLVFTDCNMPEMDGFELTEAIRREEQGQGRGQGQGQGRHTPIIALTANAMAGEDQRCLRAGMDDFLSKPIDIAQLEKCIQRWLEAEETGVEGQGGPGAAVGAGGGEVLFDPSLTLELFGVIDDDARAFLQGFLDSARPLAGAITDAFAAGDLEEARLQAHALAGVAKSAGAVALGEICSTVEQYLLAAQGVDAAHLASDINGTLERTATAIDAC